MCVIDRKTTIIAYRRNAREIEAVRATTDASAAFRVVVEDIENAWAEKAEIETMLEYSRIICDLYRTTEATARTIDKAHR